MKIRVTKFDPQHRDDRGLFTQGDWTSIFDVHKEGGPTLEEYARVEDLYVEAALRFCKIVSSGEMRIRGLETPETSSLSAARFPELVGTQEALGYAEGDWVPFSQLGIVVRACLREDMWCELVAAEGDVISFGYDYYMYCASMTVFLPPRIDGLFVELETFGQDPSRWRQI